MISGYATPEGTANFAKRQSKVAKNHFRSFDRLTLSSIGIGTYLGNPDDLTDKLVQDAIKSSITTGVNIIDTAINYRSQKAERSVGRAISELIESGKEGILVEQRNVCELGRAVEFVLQNQSTTDIGVNARKKVERCYDIEKNVPKLIEVFESLI